MVIINYHHFGILEYIFIAVSSECDEFVHVAMFKEEGEGIFGIKKTIKTHVQFT